jgi:DNA-binding transcriptional LysR family regulator
LELHLGYALFERRGRRLIPTHEAESLYREIEQIYSNLERVSHVAQDIRFQRAGALRIATLPALAHWLVPKAITRFLKIRPNVRVFVQSLPSRQIGELVATRQFDVGVVEFPLVKPAVQVEPFAPIQTMAVVPTSHPLASRKAISLKDLAGERMVMLSQHTYIRYQIDDAFASMGVAPEVVIETPSSSIACALVAAGAGISLVSRWTVETFTGVDLVAIPVEETLTSRYAIIYPDGQAPMMLAHAFSEELRALIAETDKAALNQPKNGAV